MSDFDYQQKVWGGSEIRLKPTHLAYLALKYCLESLKGIKGRVLDVGCGGGGFARAIKHYRPDLEVYGVDISKRAIGYAKCHPTVRGARFDKLTVTSAVRRRRLCRRRVGGLPFPVKFKVGDVYKLPFKKNFFDGVLAIDILEHLEKPRLALKEVNRVLKKDGVLQAHVPLEGELWALHFWLSRMGWRQKEKLTGHTQYFTWRRLKKLLVDSGFKIVKKRHSVHFFEQMVDVFYFVFLSLTGKRIKTGLEDYLRDKKFLNFGKSVIARIQNLESQVFWFLPGAGVHVKAQK